MEEKLVAPCWLCGHKDAEIKRYNEGKEKHYSAIAFNDEKIVLCEFDLHDIDSTAPSYLGCSDEQPLEVYFNDSFNVIELNGAALEQGWACISCNHRLAWLNFVSELHKRNSSVA